jgi:hypothetical protein
MAVTVDKETVEKTLSNGSFVATVRTVGTGDPVVQLTRVGTPGGSVIESLRQLAVEATEMADALEAAVVETVAKRAVPDQARVEGANEMLESIRASLRARATGDRHGGDVVVMGLVDTIVNTEKTNESLSR